MQRSANAHQRPVLAIGGGFSKAQFIYLIPLIHGYSQKHNIKDLLFFQPVDPSLLSKDFLVDILRNYNLIFYPEVKAQCNWGYLHKAVFAIGNLPLSICFLFLLTFKKAHILRNLRYLHLLHAVWDTSMLTGTDGKLSLSFVHIIRTSLFILYSFQTSLSLCKYWNISAAFMGHSCYSARAFMTGFREKGVDIYVDSAHRLIKLQSHELYKDNLFISKRQSNLILSKLDKSVIGEFWERRKAGFSYLHEARTTIHSFNSNALSAPTYDNIIFMHVFRDSPFFVVDTERIFFDYVQWISATINILRESGDIWLLKPHPSAPKWGENQMLWLNSIVKKACNGFMPSNIIIDPSPSSLSLYSAAKRIVTFNGTAHIEAACWGIKPIVISEVLLSSHSARLAFKPSTYDEYVHLLLSSSNSASFSLSESDMEYCRSLLFLIEEVCSFDRDFDTPYLFRTDGEDDYQVYIDRVGSVISSSIDQYVSIGAVMAGELEHTISAHYYRKLRDFLDPGYLANSK